MTAEFDFSEVERLARDLARAGHDVDDEVATELGIAALKVHAFAAAAAPRLTGELAGSVYVRSARLERTIGSDEPQGFYQEFGTSRMPPQPWLFPAADRVLDELADRIERLADPLA